MNIVNKIVDMPAAQWPEKVDVDSHVSLGKATYIELFFDLVFTFCIHSILPIITDSPDGTANWYTYYTFWFTFALAEGLMAVSAVAVFLSSNDLIGLFRNDSTVIEIGTRALKLHCGALFFLPICMVTEMLYQSTGHKLGAAALSSMRSGVIFIPALLILSRLRGLAGIQEAQPLAYVLAFFPALWLVLRFLRKMPVENSE